jgi:hypothetical protein
MVSSSSSSSKQQRQSSAPPARQPGPSGAKEPGRSGPVPGARRGDAGAVLITVMLVMFALLGVGVTALWMTSGNLQIGANTNMRSQALYVAEAGIERVRADLNGSPQRSMTALLTGSGHILDNVPTGTGVDSSGNPNGLGAIYHWDVSYPTPRPGPLSAIDFPPTSFNRGYGGSGPQSTTMGRYTVWIRNDTAELRQGGLITTDSNNTIVIRSRGVASDGRTEVVLEVTLSPGFGSSSTTFCNAGKNACDENSSTLTGIYAQ